MADKKENLKLLLKFIESVLEEEGNEWFHDKLLEMVAGTNSVQINPTLNQIKEYCIESKIKKQAEVFYENFPIIDIKDQLISDYKKMEKQRRMDRFEDFCLCMYQQFEGIIEFLFKNKVEGYWGTDQNNICYKNKINHKNITLRELIFRDKNVIWYANNKFKVVSYYFYFNKNIYNDYNINMLAKDFDRLYQVRNKNHRGGEMKPYQKQLLDQVYENYSQYYHKFYGFLQDFISKVEASLNSSEK